MKSYTLDLIRTRDVSLVAPRKASKFTTLILLKILLKEVIIKFFQTFEYQ